MIASMTPKVGSLAVVHCSPAAQAESTATGGANGLFRRRCGSDNFFAVNCVRCFHIIPVPSFSLRPDGDQPDVPIDKLKKCRDQDKTGYL
jgi:hypothetical protein